MKNECLKNGTELFHEMKKLNFCRSFDVLNLAVLKMDAERDVSTVAWNFENNLSLIQLYDCPDFEGLTTLLFPKIIQFLEESIH